MAASQQPAARWFGGAGQAGGAAPPLLETTWGLPAVDGSCAVYLCRVVGSQAVNGQVVVTARFAERVEASGGPPLVYRKEDYA